MIENETLTSGMIGKKVKLEFSSEWSNLRKTAVFTAGSVTRDVVGVIDEVEIPAEVLAVPLKQLYVGVYGVSSDGRVTPTIRVMGPVIEPGMDPSGDEGLDPELPVWAQLQCMIGDLQNLNTKDKSNLVAAVNEAMSNTGGGGGGYYTPVVTQTTANTMQISFTPSAAKMPAVEPVTINLPGTDSSQTVVIDTTLTVEGAAADAKAVGDAIAEEAQVRLAIENALMALQYSVVKSVNGTTPDEAGNVEIIISDSSQSGNCLLTVETITIGEPGDIPVTGITLDYNSISLTEGESMLLAASVTPGNATNKTVLWESGNTSIVTVDNGYVTAVAEGNAVITAKSAENSSIKATCSVGVAAESGGNSGTTDGKIMLADLTPVNTGVMLKKDGVTEYAHSSCYGYFKLPYADGMVVSTVGNSSFIANYPAIMVIENGTVNIPEWSVDTISGTIGVYAATLSGYDSGAEVVVNLTNVNGTGEAYMVNAYYIPGGAD